jgi:hypothetical protein
MQTELFSLRYCFSIRVCQKVIRGNALDEKGKLVGYAHKVVLLMNFAAIVADKAETINRSLVKIRKTDCLEFFDLRAAIADVSIHPLVRTLACGN